MTNAGQCPLDAGIEIHSAGGEPSRRLDWMEPARTSPIATWDEADHVALSTVIGPELYCREG